MAPDLWGPHSIFCPGAPEFLVSPLHDVHGIVVWPEKTTSVPHDDTVRTAICWKSSGYYHHCRVIFIIIRSDFNQRFAFLVSYKFYPKQSELDLSGGMFDLPLVPLNPPSFHWPPLVQSKIHKKYIADPRLVSPQIEYWRQLKLPLHACPSIRPTIYWNSSHAPCKYNWVTSSN